RTSQLCMRRRMKLILLVWFIMRVTEQRLTQMFTPLCTATLKDWKISVNSAKANNRISIVNMRMPWEMAPAVWMITSKSCENMIACTADSSGNGMIMELNKHEMEKQLGSMVETLVIRQTTATSVLTV